MEDYLNILQIILKVVIIMFGIPAFIFSFLDISLEDKNDKIRFFFSKIWHKITNSKLLLLPEKVIRQFLKIQEFFLISAFYITTRNIIGTIIWSGLPFFLFIGGAIVFNYITGFIIFILMYLSITFIPKIKIFENKFEILFLIIYSIFSISFLITGLIWTYIALQENIVYSFILMIFIPILYWLSLLTLIIGVGLYLLFHYVEYKFHDSSNIEFIRTKELLNYINNPHMPLNIAFTLINIGFAIPISFFITFLSFFIGHLIEPNEWIPQTTQMLFSNVFFDSLTLLTTFFLLSCAIDKKYKLNIPIAIILDIITASVFACCSLYLGLIFTDNMLSIKKVIYIFVAKSFYNNSYYLGPLFWVMHTTFIPTIIYLSFIIIAWLCKIFIIPLIWICGKVRIHNNPLKLTAGFLGMISGIALILLKII